MRRKLAILICLLFLASGLIRIGVGGMMIGQAAGWWSFDGEAVEALAETRLFIAGQEANLVGFTPISYFAFILFMGVTISLGAIGQIWRKQWGLVLIGIYLLSHGALFVNFMTVNPKIFLWGLSVLMTAILVWANRPPPPEKGLLPA
ncbi:hypothetical protein [Sphingorhabdus sp. EL138]|uniref:hypothetical protein n=1 Tax=Sphingorhabdus sp. EL138 TaxID=2073156 RepID=UPI000D69E982|nr:hypothetical protein [Sphingorhabdus sp. EL138]